MPNKEFSAYGGDKIIDLENENVVDAFSEAIGGGEGSSDKEITCYGIIADYGEEYTVYNLSFDFSTESDWKPDWVTSDKLIELEENMGCFPLIKVILIDEYNDFSLVCYTVQQGTGDLSAGFFNPPIFATLDASSNEAHVYEPTIAFFGGRFRNSNDNEEEESQILTCSRTGEFPIHEWPTNGNLLIDSGEGTQANPYTTSVTEARLTKIPEYFYTGKLSFTIYEDDSSKIIRPITSIESTDNKYTYISYDASGTPIYLTVQSNSNN